MPSTPCRLLDPDRPMDGPGCLPLLPAVIEELERLAAGDVCRHRLRLLAHADPILCAQLLAATDWGMGSRLSIHACISQWTHGQLVAFGRRLLGDVEESRRTLSLLGDEGRSLWTHSVETAVTARFLSEELWFGSASFEEAYLVGLLHDLGRFVLATGSPDLVHEVDASRWTTPLSLLAAEREIVGQDHAQLGFLHGMALGLPDRLLHLILRHHDYQRPDPALADAQESELLTCVQMADFFSVLVTLEPRVPELAEEELAAEIVARCVHPSWPAPPVDAKSLARMTPRILAEVEEYLELLGLGGTGAEAPPRVSTWTWQAAAPDRRSA